ncbi:MAG: alpha/beta hydrolase, partial [Phaeodactylibacter sp.]|nr:alpha/beta hydrolase [Phaeodactylibacter sp.]
MKRYLFLMVPLCLGLFACRQENPQPQTAQLVPQTVAEDSSLPALALNGTLLHVETYGAPTDPMIVFLHGGPGGDYQNGLNARQLADDGYFVVFYDQRGSGLSQRHNQAVYSIQVMLDDLTALIAHFRTAPEQKVFLFGHSWGAMLAAAYINAYPDRIDGAVFAEPGGLNKDLLDAYGSASRKLELFSESTNDVLYLDQFLTVGDDPHAVLDYKQSVLSAFAYHEGNAEGIEGPSPFYRYGAVTLNSFIEIAETEGFDFTTHLQQFTTKVLFLYGELNLSYGLAFAQKEAAFFPHAEIVQIADTGHEMIHFKWDRVYLEV